MHRSSENLNDTDLLVHWAAEEYVAAGRVEDADRCEIHRRRAAFFAETFRTLRQPVPAETGHENDAGTIGTVLRRAFGSPWRRR